MDSRDNQQILADSIVQGISRKIISIIATKEDITRKSLAQKVKVSEKTLLNWLNHPSAHAIPVDKLIRVGLGLGIPPHLLFPSSPEISTFTKNSVKNTPEEMLLQLEQTIPPGQYKKVVFPLFSSPLQEKTLSDTYWDKGLYTRKSKDTRVKELFDKSRKARIELFEQGHYLMQSIIMRSEFDHFVNREKLFKDLSKEDVVSQLKHILKLMKDHTWNNMDRLSMRMSSDYFRQHYGIYKRSDGSDVIVLNTNTGYISITSPVLHNFYQHEFSILWEEETEKNIRTLEEWESFIGKAITAADNDERFAAKSILHPQQKEQIENTQ